MQIDSLPFTAAAAATRMGAAHEENDDCYCIFDDRSSLVASLRRGVLFAVCDGVSTVPDGRWAARLTCDRLSAFFDADVSPSHDGLLQLINEIDWELRGRGPGRAACTLSALWLADGIAHMIHVGDSDVFRVRNGTIKVISEHQSSGRQLGAYMGMGPLLNEVAQVWHQPLFEGDLFVLATDGVTGLLNKDELLDHWWNADGDPESCADRIIDLTEERQGADDATVMIVDVLALEADSDD